MKLFNRFFIVVTLFSTLFFVQCNCEDDEGGTPEPVEATLVEMLANDYENLGAWQLQSATDETGASLGDASGYTLDLAQSSGNPTSYTFTTGAVTLTPGAASGTWSLTGSEDGINFGSATVTFVGTPTERSLQYRWIDADDKNQPTYTFTFTR